MMENRTLSQFLFQIHNIRDSSFRLSFDQPENFNRRPNRAAVWVRVSRSVPPPEISEFPIAFDQFAGQVRSDQAQAMMLKIIQSRHGGE
jgi:hypothetical protein